MILGRRVRIKGHNLRHPGMLALLLEVMVDEKEKKKE